MKKYNIPQSVLIFGASGKIGHSLYFGLSKSNKYKVAGTIRTVEKLKLFPKKFQSNLITNTNVFDHQSVENVIRATKPSIIINAIGLVKQDELVNDLRKSFPINSLWPHVLSGIASKHNAHIIQISSDCVFSGKKGMYTENDVPDPVDVYGQTKWLGELTLENCTTIRTSTIGHELNTKHGLVDWLLAQTGVVTGYINAIYTGLPTVELAHIFSDYLVPNLHLLPRIVNIGSKPINKYDLLTKIATKYGKKVTINPAKEPYCDRSLNSELFRKITKYQAPDWDQLVDSMYDNYIESGIYEII